MSRVEAEIGTRRRWRRWIGLTALGLVLLGLAVAVAVHTAPVRREVLRRVVAALETRFNLSLGADDLDYNLFNLRISLTRVRLAATSAATEPFLQADRIEVDVPRSALFGILTLKGVRLENARVFVIRHADGRTNLPTANETATGSPPALPIGTISISRLALDVTDEVNDLSFNVPALTAQVPPTGGTLRLLEPGRLRRGMVETPITALGGGIGWDGRTVRLATFSGTTQEASIVVDGTLGVLVDEPGMDLRVSGRADVRGAARWGTGSVVPTGTVALDGTVRGAYARPTAAARVQSDALSYEGLTASALSGDVVIDGDHLSVSQATAALVGGRVSVAGERRFDTSESALSASWSNLDLSTLTRALAPDLNVLPAGRATGTGTGRGPGVDLSRWALQVRNQTVGGTAPPAHLAMPGTSTLVFAAGGWTLDAEHAIGGAPVRADLEGRLDGERIASSTLGGSITMEEADFPAFLAALRNAGLVTVENAVLGAGRIEAGTKLSGTLNAPRLDIVATAHDVEAQGVANLSALATASGTPERLDFETRVRQGQRNEVLATGVLRIADRALDARITGQLADPAAFAGGAPIGGTADLQLDAGGGFDALAVRGVVTVTDARYGTTGLGRVDSTVALDAGTARVDASIAELSARVNARIELGEPRAAAIDLTLEDTDISRLVRDVPSSVALTGRLSLTARAEGPLANWRTGTASVAISRIDAQAGDLPIRLAGPARAGYAGGTFEVSSLNAIAGNLRVSIIGRLPLANAGAIVPPADALRVELAGDLADVIDAATASGLVTRPDVSGAGPVALLARITGSAEEPVVAADLEVADGSIVTGNLPAATGVELRAHVGDGWIDLFSATARWQEGLFTSSGRVPVRLVGPYLPQALLDALPTTTGSASLTARASGITPTVLAPFLDADTISQIEGSVDLSADLTAAALEFDAVQGSVTVDRFDVRMAGLPIAQREPTRIVFNGGFASVESWDWTGQGTELAVRGRVRLADRQAALLANGRLDLRMLTPFVRSAGITLNGVLEPRVSVTGPLDSPRLDGDVALRLGDVRMANPQIVATELTAQAVLSRTTMFISNLSGTVNGGTLTGEGEVTIGPGGQPTSSLSAELRGVALEFPDGLRSALDANLTLALAAPTGASSLSGRVTGDVTVIESGYREPLAVVAGVLTALRNRGLTTAAIGGESTLDRLGLDIRVVTDSDVIVDNNLARLQLGADLRLIGTAASPALSGRADLREGGQLFLGRNVYTIESGAVNFSNPSFVEPNLNIRAQTRAGGEEIELTMTGTPETLDVALRSTSNPDLGEADVASLLLTGRTLSEVPSAEAEIVGEQVLGYLSGDVLGVAGRAVGLDTLRLGGTEESLLRRDPSEIATETDPTSRLTVGRRIGERLEVTLSQSLRDGDGQTWIVDYLAGRRLNLRFVTDDDNLRAYEFRHDVSFGAASAASRPRPRVVERIVAVTVTGDFALPEPRVLDAIDIDPGDAFDFVEWQRGRERLETLYRREGYREARISERRIEGDGGVTLTFAVMAGPHTAISVSGYALGGETLEAIDEAWVQSIFDDFLVAETEGIVRRALADDGYLQPTVTVALSTPGDKTLSITVEPGMRTRDRRIDVEAGDPALVDDLDDRIESRSLADAAWTDSTALQQDLVRYLQTRGHLLAEATVAPPAVIDGVAVLPVTVVAGPVFTIEDVRVEGASTRAPSEVFEIGRLDLGAPYVPAEVDAERQRLAAAYRRGGFSDARVTVRPAVDDATRRVVVVFAVDEGPQQVLRDVVVEGNTGIDPDVVTRALALRIGEPLGADAWLQARSRVFDTGLFQRVDVSVQPAGGAPAADAQQPVTAHVTVREWPALRLRYGFRVSEERPIDDVEGRDLTPGLSADITRRTLFGRAVSLGGAVDYQRGYRLGRVFAAAPTFLSLPVESIITLERSREDRASVTLVTDQTGISWEQRVRVARSLRLSYSYRFDRDHTFDTSPPIDSTLPAFDITVNIARLSAAAVYDTRNDPADTERGSLFASNVEHAPTNLGSDLNFVRYLGQAYHFRPWRRLVLASAARLGFVVPLGGQVIIPSERFFAGGARSVRGVAEDGLGPVAFDGLPTGGEALVILNQEVRFPIYGWLRGVGFVDSGNVFAHPADVHLGDLRGSFGAGLRLATPFAMLRVDYAKLWSPKPDERPARWTFGIGQAF